jgi:hypothetical protein
MKNLSIKAVLPENCFIHYTLESIQNKIELPIVKRCDNIGAIFAYEFEF